MKGPRAALQARRHRRLVAQAMDTAFYLDQFEAGARPRKPIDHYLGGGWRDGFEPAPWFDSAYYESAYPDVIAAGLPPFVHYLAHGRAEGRPPTPPDDRYDDLRPWFDAEFYCRRYPELGLPNGRDDPFEHFAYTGWREGRDPNAWFSIAAWRAAHPDARNDINPLALHLRDGLRRGPAQAARRRRALASGLIDDRYYLSLYPEAAATGLAPVDHYLVAGAAALHNPGPRFDTGWWAAQRGIDPREALFDFIEARDRAGGTLSGRPPETVTFDAASPSSGAAAAQIAVHLHLRNLHLAEWLVGALARWPAETALWASVGSEADAVWLRSRLAGLRPKAACEVRVDPRLGGGVLPQAFADRAGEVAAVLCLHSEGIVGGGRQLDLLLAAPAAAGQAAARFAEASDLSWLHPETDSAVRRASPKALGGVPASVGWLGARSLANLGAASDSPFDPDIDALALELRLAESLTAQLPGGTAAFVWPECARLEITPPPASPARLDPPGRRWAREDPAVGLWPPKAPAPRSKVFDPDRLDIAWVMPDLLKGSGGHMTILRLVEQLARFGHRQTIWIQNPRYPDPRPIKQRMQHGFRPIPDDVAVAVLPDDMRAVSADAVIATEAWSAFPVANVTNAKARFYLIQDYEPLFFPAGETAILAEQTYALGLDALTAGDWLLGKAEEHGMWARKWDLAVDHAVYFPAVSPPRAVPRIAVYARRSTPRRAVNLAIAALTELHRRGVLFEAAMFGDDNPPTDLVFPHVHAGIAPPEALGELYRGSDVGLVFSATNYSLVPLEMMACGLPVVELDGESTRAVFRADEAVLAAPSPASVADALQALLTDPAARQAHAAKGRAFVEPLSWEASARSIETAIRERLLERGAKPIDPTAVCAPAIGRPRRASVVIPTYNGGAQFGRVLEAVAGQQASFDYDILVIDSGSTDGTAETAERAGGRVRLQRIDKSRFQHGRTRNLGVERTEGDVVAFLTQDALPADDQWLARLVEGFDASDRTALVFGRHRAYPEHGPFVARDLDGLFDQFRALGTLHSTRLGLPSFIHAGGEEWRRLMAFHSDNNAAVLRAAWRALPYPEIDWGEDQVLGWEMVRQGFDKAYADGAVVFHSHQRPASEQLQTGVEEGLLFKREFGLDLVTEAEAASFLAAMTAAETAFAQGRGLSAGALAMRLESLRLSIEGRLRGAALAGD